MPIIMRQSWVENTYMPPETPMVAGMAKTSSDWMNVSSAPDKMAGAAMGSVIRSVVFHWFAPLTWAAYSSVGSMFLNAVTVKMKTYGARERAITKMSPPMVKMSNSGSLVPTIHFQNRLTKPTRGVPRYAQATATTTGGMMKGKIATMLM